MNKRLLFNVFCVIILAVAGVGTVKAFNANIYASQSKLSNGKWVKIAIPEDGMYEISFNELHQMGFRNPQNVNLYGTGGHPSARYLMAMPSTTSSKCLAKYMATSCASMPAVR